MLVVFLVGQVPLLPNTSVSQLGWLVTLGEMATLALVQLYRYRWVSSPRERQQTKWVVFGLAVPITVAVSVSVPYLMFPVAASPVPSTRWLTIRSASCWGSAAHSRLGSPCCALGCGTLMCSSTACWS